MIVKRDLSTDVLLEQLINYEQIVELVAAGKSELAGEFIHKGRLIVENASDPLMSHLLAIAWYVCDASRQNHEQLDWYRSAIEEIARREAELEQRLIAILKVVEVIGRYARTGRPDESSPICLPIPGVGDQQPRSMFGWQDVVDFFKPETAPELHDVPRKIAAPAKAVEGPVDPTPVADLSHSLAVYTLGTFQVYRNDELIENWPSRKGMLLFKYLIMNPERPTHKEILMEMFWPDSEEEAQRNNLNVVIYGLRQALRNGDPAFSHVLFQNDCYFLNPDLCIWVDFEAFQEHFRNGQQYEQTGDEAGMLRQYTAAETLYQGNLFPEDCFEEWTESLRSSLENSYLSLLHSLSQYYFQAGNYCACINTCHKMLKIDTCQEQVHVCLMYCYARQGQSYLALRQYDQCLKVLAAELDVAPMPETTHLYRRIRSGEWV